jgi:hypothetical protein
LKQDEYDGLRHLDINFIWLSLGIRHRTDQETIVGVIKERVASIYSVDSNESL